MGEIKNPGGTLQENGDGGDREPGFGDNNKVMAVAVRGYMWKGVGPEAAECVGKRLHIPTR